MNIYIHIAANVQVFAIYVSVALYSLQSFAPEHPPKILYLIQQKF